MEGELKKKIEESERSIKKSIEDARKSADDRLAAANADKERQAKAEADKAE